MPQRDARSRGAPRSVAGALQPLARPRAFRRRRDDAGHRKLRAVRRSGFRAPPSRAYPFNISDRSSEQREHARRDVHGAPRAARQPLRREPGARDPRRDRRCAAASVFREGDVETVRGWVRDSQIRWGIDGAHRARFGLPATHEHTWRFGLERLLLGYALPGGNERLFAGILPVRRGRRQPRRACSAASRATPKARSRSTRRSPERSRSRDGASSCTACSRDFFDPPEERAEELEAVRAAVARDRPRSARGALYAGGPARRW